MPRPFEAAIGNPPFDMAEGSFAARSLVDANRFVAFLLRITFLAGQGRVPLYRHFPVWAFRPIAGRPSFTGVGSDPSEYGLFVWRVKDTRGDGRILPPFEWKGGASGLTAGGRRNLRTSASPAECAPPGTLPEDQRETDDMAEKNGTTHEPKITRKAFKKGEKERHFELLAKNEIALRTAKAKVKKCQDAIETILDDIQAGGYAEEPQGELDVGQGSDDGDEVRA
jgi:hypothetical protein